MNKLPISLILVDILPLLVPSDRLSLSMTCKSFYESIPRQVSLYSRKYKIGQVLCEMITFINAGPFEIARWSFMYTCNNPKKCKSLCLIRSGKGECALINGKSGLMRKDEILAWFEANIYPYRENIIFGTGCWYQSKYKKDTYRQLTTKMTELLM